MSSREEAQALRVQLEEQRERARKEMHEAQRHGNDAQSELERSHINLRRLEEEVRVCVHAYSLSWPGCCFSSENDVCLNVSNSFDTIYGTCLTTARQ